MKLRKLGKESLGEVPEDMKPACLSGNGSAKKTENIVHRKCPNIVLCLLLGRLKVGTEVKFFSHSIFLI